MSMNHPGLGVPEREELINTHTYTHTPGRSLHLPGSHQGLL